MFETQLVKVDKIPGTNERFKIMLYAELDQLSDTSSVSFKEKAKLRENINVLFRQGLLIITQKGCLEGSGIYFSEAQYWEIVRL